MSFTYQQVEMKSGATPGVTGSSVAPGRITLCGCYWHDDISKCGLVTGDET